VRVNDESGSWVEEEFEALDLGDPRRDRRAKALLKRLAAKPTESIPGACDGWGETIGSCVGLAYVRAPNKAVINAEWINFGSYKVNAGGQLYPISVSLKPLYDPTNARIRP